MKCTSYRISDRLIYLIEVDFSLKQSENCRDHCFHTSVDSYKSFYEEIVDFVQSASCSMKKNIDYIIYSRRIIFKHSFEAGVENQIRMIVGQSHFRTNKLDWEIDEIFRNELRPFLLQKKMDDRFISIFLNSLRKSILIPNNETEKLIENFGLHGHCGNHDMGLLDEIRQRIQNLSDNQISLIVKTILNNEITYSTSSNVFNLHKNEPTQQNALRIKSVHKDNNQNSLNIAPNKTYQIIDVEHLSAVELKSGYTYIIKNNGYVFIEMDINYLKFCDLLSRDIFYCFKIVATEMAMIQLQAAVRNDLYQSFYELKINRALIQFRVMKPIEYDDIEIACCEHPKIGIWQSGNSRLLNMMKFREETLKNEMKTFEIYGVFCFEFLETIAKRTKCVLTIKRCIEFDNFKFYYTLCTINTFFATYVLNELIPYYVGRKCFKMVDNCSIEKAIWYERSCCVLFYHTHFKWVCDALQVNEMAAKDIIEVATQNLINYKYINATKNLNITLNTETDAETYAQILIETRRNVFRDLEQFHYRTVSAADVESPDKKQRKRRKKLDGVKFSQFDGVKDGPLVSATSIRLCEKITNNSVLEKDWNINVLNVAMLLNIPDYRGVQNPINSLIL